MYNNKCTKCGKEFETKNPKRVICPSCLYPDRKDISLNSYNETLSPSQDASDQQPSAGQDKNYSSGRFVSRETPSQRPQQGGYNQDRGGYSQDRGGFRRPQQQGGYNQDRGGYNQDRGGYNQGGFRKPQQGGYNQDRGGYNQDRGGFRRPQQQGGYNQDRGGYNRGSYNQDRGGYNQGGFRRPQQGGYSQDRGGYNRGGYNQDRGGYNQGGFRRPQQGGYNRGGRPQGPRRAPAANKKLLVSREQVAEIETLYTKLLPLPNPDCHEVIGEKINLEPNKVFFGINLVRQKLRLPKLPYPKRKLAVSPDQLMAIQNLYSPLLPLPPIGCHKIIAKQLKIDEWRVHVGIGIIRKQMDLPRWNAEREDAPEEFKKQAKEAKAVEEAKVEEKTKVEETSADAIETEEVEEKPKKETKAKKTTAKKASTTKKTVTKKATATKAKKTKEEVKEEPETEQEAESEE